MIKVQSILNLYKTYKESPHAFQHGGRVDTENMSQSAGPSRGLLFLSSLAIFGASFQVIGPFFTSRPFPH